VAVRSRCDLTARVAELYAFDKQIILSVVPSGVATSNTTSGSPKSLIVAGFDEAGRGALAGPVVVGCVGSVRSKPGGLSIANYLSGLDDSKRVSPKKREKLFERILLAFYCGVGAASSGEIDQMGIVAASSLAALRAYRSMGRLVDLLLLDRGLSLKKAPVASKNSPTTPPELSFTRGDSKSLRIAAASILAKVTRDRMMTQFAPYFPDYKFAKNKGYGTPVHLAALREVGPSSIHRTSFKNPFSIKAHLVGKSIDTCHFKGYTAC